MNSVVPLEVTHYLVNRKRNSERFVGSFLGMENVTVEPVDVRMVRRANELLRAHPSMGI